MVTTLEGKCEILPGMRRTTTPWATRFRCPKLQAGTPNLEMASTASLPRSRCISSFPLLFFIPITIMIIMEGFQALGLAPIEFEKSGSITILYPSGGGGRGRRKYVFCLGGSLVESGACYSGYRGGL